MHLFGARGLSLAYDVNSGSLHVLDEGAAVVLREWLDRGGPPATPPATSAAEAADSAETGAADGAARELRELVSRGQLFAPPAAAPAEVADVGVRALCLHLAHDCNLSCRYCFAASGALKGPRALMSLDAAQSGVDFLIRNSKGYPYLAIDFFGGEPLLDWDVLVGTVEYARRRGAEEGRQFRFTVTTNAYALSGDMIPFLAANMDNIVLSIDGRPEVHDRMRRTRGAPTHAPCLANARKMVEALEPYRVERGPSHYIRGTFTAANLDFHRDVEYLLDQGFTEISMEPVVLTGGPLALTADHLEEINRSYEELARLYVRRHQEGRPFTFYHFEMDSHSGPCLEKRLTGCGAGYQYLALTPERELYPCHQFVGRPAYLMGHLTDLAGKAGPANPADRSDPAHATGGSALLADDFRAQALSKRFRQNHAGSKEACRSCWARYLCGGGCHANADQFHGGLDRPYEVGCLLARMRWEWALWARAARDLGLS